MTWIAVGVAAIGTAGSIYASNQAAQGQANALAQEQGNINTVEGLEGPYNAAGLSALGAINQGFGSGMTVDQMAQAILNKYPTWNAVGDPNDPSNHGTPDQIVQTFQSEGANTPGVNPGDVSAFTGGYGSGITPGQFTHSFDASDLNSNLAPNYQFMLGQGQAAAANALNLTGGLGGNFAQGLEQYTQNYAQNAYQQAYDNYNTNQTNIFNRLADIAGLGQTAVGTDASAITGVTPSQASSNAGSGAASAAGTIGASNALQNAGSWYNVTGGSGSFLDGLAGSGIASEGI